MNLYCASY